MLRFYLVAFALSGSLVSTIIAFAAWMRRPAPGAAYLAGAMASVAVYAMGYALELSNSSLDMILRYIRVEYFGVVWLPGFWLALVLSYTNKLRWLKPNRIMFLWIIPLIVLLGVLTNPLHNLFYASVSLDNSGQFPVLDFERGPIYWLHMGYTFFSFIVSAFLLIQYLLSPHTLYRRQSALLLLSSVITILVTALYLAGVQPIPNLDIIVFALILSGAIVGWGLLRFHLIAISPIARDTLFDNLHDAVMVLDSADRLVDFNPAAHQLFNFFGNPIGRSLSEVLTPEFLQTFSGLRDISDMREFTLERGGIQRHFEIHPARLPGAGGERESILVMIQDISRRKQMLTALEELNSELDQRVHQRTQEYLDTIERLEEEIQIRQKTEDRLQEMKDNLVEQVSTQSRKLYTLYDVLLYQGGVEETDQILAQSLARIKQMMDARAVCIHELRDNACYRLASVGLSKEEDEALEVLPGDWLNEGKAFVSVDLPHEERLPQALRLPGYTTYLAAPIKLRNVATGVLQVFWSEPQNVLVEDISYFSIIAEQIGIIQENDRLRKILEDRAVQVERRRLARDLHDSVTQSLHSLSLYTGILRNRLQQGQSAKAEELLDRLDLSARQALKEMRLLLYEMRLAPLENLRLVETLTNRLEAVEMRAGIDAALQLHEPALWPLKWESELYCIAMEALNNSLKYADANQVRVNLSGGGNWVEMSIQDNGRGFSPEKLGNSGIGLQSMRERAERLGGELRIESTTGQGTTIYLRVGNLMVEKNDEEEEQIS